MKLQKDVQQIQTSLGGIASAATKLAGTLGVVFSVGAVVSFGRQLLVDADALVKLSDKTGIALQGLQRLQVAGDGAGNTLDQLTGAVNMLQKRLVSDADAVVPALARLGLSFDAIRAMAPDQQFMAIGDAIRQVEDPAARVALAVALFGRSGAEVLPTLIRGFEDLRNSAVGMSDETIRALDRLGDGWARLWRKTKGILAEMVVAAAESTGAMTGLFTGKFDQPGLVGSNRGDFNASPLEVAERRRPTMVIGAGFDPANNLATKSTLELRLAEIALTDATTAGIAAKQRAQTETKKLAAELDRSTTSVRALESGFYGLSTGVLAFENGEIEAVKQTLALRQEVDRVEQTARIANFGFQGMASELTQVGTAFDVANEPLIKFAREIGFVGPTIDMVEYKVQTFGKTLISTFGKLPQILVSAFTGGGGIGGALKAFGTDLGASLFGAGGAFAAATSKATGGLTKMFGNTIGNALGAAIPGIGALIGPALSGLWKGIGKLFGNNAEKQINPIRQAFVDAAGGLEALNVKAQAAGLTLDRLLDAKNPKQYTAAINELTAAFNELAADQTRANELIAEYGLVIDQLGPKWRAQQLQEQASGLLNDFRIMVGVLGVSMPDAINLMSGKFSDYVNMAVRTGTEIPAAMQPILEQMIRQGTLLDANGVAFTDLGAVGITFAETLTQGFDRVVDRLNALLRGLGLIPAAAETAGTAAGGAFARIRDAAENAAAAVDTLNFGSSPGGLKEIPIQFDLGAEAAVVFAETVVREMDIAKRRVDTTAGAVEEVARLTDVASAAFAGWVDRLGDTGPETERFRRMAQDLDVTATRFDLARDATDRFADRSVASLDRVRTSVETLTASAIMSADALGMMFNGRFDTGPQTMAQYAGRVRTRAGWAAMPPEDDRRLPSFAAGSHGFQDFGQGTLALLHGREAIVPEGQGQGRGGHEIAAVRAELAALRRDLKRVLPQAVGVAVRDAVAMAR